MPRSCHELAELEVEVSNITLIGAVDCLTGQNGPHPYYAIPVLRLPCFCLPSRLWGETWTGFPLSWHFQVLEAGPQP